jgi:outer membrane protein OmpA-like peptidoglycan-associated protein
MGQIGRGTRAAFAMCPRRRRCVPKENDMSRLLCRDPALVGFMVVCSLPGLGCAHSTQRHTAQVARLEEHRVESRIVLTPQPNPTDRTCNLETVYFDVGSALLDERAKQNVLDAVTCFTRTGMPTQLVITGATDPRGTEEYNLALGHRRAAAVQNLLMILGIAPVRISISSVGEEHAAGHDEEGWRLDRRALAASQ